VSSNVTNAWFPLRPGTVLRYEGTDEGVPVKDVLSVTSKTRAVAGGRARVVHDRVFKHGRVVEDTLDYYAQDGAGNVWYFGEATKELNARGRVMTREGSWEDGENGALAAEEAGLVPVVADPARGAHVPVVADVGTGSGAIIVALGKQLPPQVTAEVLALPQ